MAGQKSERVTAVTPVIMYQQPFPIPLVANNNNNDSGGGGGGGGGGGQVRLVTPVVPTGAQIVPFANPELGPVMRLKSLFPRAGAWIDGVSQNGVLIFRAPGYVTVGSVASGAQYQSVAAAVADRDPTSPLTGNQNIMIVSDVIESVTPDLRGGEYEIRINDGATWFFQPGILLRSPGAIDSASVRILGSSNLNTSRVVIQPFVGQNWANVGPAGQLGLQQVRLENFGVGGVAGSGTNVRAEALNLFLGNGAFGFSDLAGGSVFSQSSFSGDTPGGPFVAQQTQKLQIDNATVIWTLGINGNSWFEWTENSEPGDGLIDGLVVDLSSGGGTGSGVIACPVVRRVSSLPKSSATLDLLWRPVGDTTRGEASFSDGRLASLSVNVNLAGGASSVATTTLRNVVLDTDLRIISTNPATLAELHVETSHFRYVRATQPSFLAHLCLRDCDLSNVYFIDPLTLFPLTIQEFESWGCSYQLPVGSLVTEVITLNTGNPARSQFQGNTFDTVHLRDVTAVSQLTFQGNNLTTSDPSVSLLLSLDPLANPSGLIANKNLLGNRFLWPTLDGTVPAVQLGIPGTIFAENQIVVTSSPDTPPVTLSVIPINGVTNSSKIQVLGNQVIAGSLSTLQCDFMTLSQNRVDFDILADICLIPVIEGNSVGRRLGVYQCNRSAVTSNVCTQAQIPGSVVLDIIQSNGGTVNGNVGFSDLSVDTCTATSVTGNTNVGRIVLDTCFFCNVTGNQTSEALEVTDCQGIVISGNRFSTLTLTNSPLSSITGNTGGATDVTVVSSDRCVISSNILAVGGVGFDIQNSSFTSVIGNQASFIHFSVAGTNQTLSNNVLLPASPGAIDLGGFSVSAVTASIVTSNNLPGSTIIGTTGFDIVQFNVV